MEQAFAVACCHDQAEFLNKTAREMFGVCKGRSGYEGQLWEIAKHINKDGESMLRGLVHFMDLKVKDMGQ